MLYLFDIDGVVVDSENQLRESFCLFLAELGKHIDWREIRPLIGLPISEILRYLDIDASVSEIAKFREVARGTEASKPFDGIVEVFRQLSDEKIPFGFLTSKDLTRAGLALRALDLPAPHIFTPSLVLRGKPHPDLFHWAKQVFELETVRYFGDTKWDWEASVAASSDFIFCEWGFGELPEYVGKRCLEPGQILDFI